ncbi:MAG: tetratricopeptide repeat protein [Myxococcales bacterium]|nr:tetratricopeptide repeat protein [Myxococcales bacterium]MCB9534711.1 tetratricopeptide repeat protein [Myxococcales bacterium]
MKHTHRRPTPLPAALGLVALVALTACGRQNIRPDDKPSEPIEMEAMVVEFDPDAAEGEQVTAFDAQELFDEGQAAAKRHDFAACAEHYGKLLDRFPASRFAHATLYNRGLCLEQLKRHGEAAVHFRRHAQLATELRDRRDGEFRMGYNLVQSGDYPTAMHLYDMLLVQPDLGPADLAECHLRRGTALLRMKRYGEAERDLKHAMRRVEEAYGDHLRGNDLLAEAHFRRAEIYQRLTHDVGLKLPVASMKGDLADKVKFFRQAQSSYIDALNVQHSYWATAAGLKLGELYEQFYMDVMQAEVPADFDALTRRYYLFELRKQLQPLLEQSLTIYEKNITMSERLGAENEWVTETETRLARLRALIEETQRAASPLDEAPQDETPKPAPPAADDGARETG